MSRTKPGLSPTMDVIESRLLLSTAAPLASAHALSRVAREIKAIVNVLVKTDNTVQANTQLTGLAAQIAPSSPSLATSWQNDVALYRPGSPKSTIGTQTRIIGDLHRYLEGGTNSGSQLAPGMGSTTSGTSTQGAEGTPASNQGNSGTSAPASTPGLDSVRIENTTGLTLVVTVYLDDSQNPQPFITETIPAQGDPTALFNFGTSTGAFMTMNISRADGLQSPAPFDNVQLSQPLSGYNGTLFTISLLGPYFNVIFS